MSEKDDIAILSRYRFPEFRDSGDWEKKKLGEVCNYWNGDSHESNVNENGEYYLISLNSIDIDGNLKSEMKKITYTDHSLKKNDLIMVLSDIAHGNFLGLTAIIPNDRYVLNQRMGCLRIKDSKNASPFFIRAYINYNQKYFKYNGQGSSQLNLSKSSVIDFSMLLPSLAEQQKNADCLSSIDALISAEEKKLSLLNDYKKGWMQKLFPAEGKNVPEWRFPEFQDSGEWAKATIGEIADYENGKAHENDIMDNGKYIVVNSKFISTEGEIIKYTNVANLLAYKGDVLMVLSDVPNGRALSKCYLVEKDNVYTVNQRVCRITPRKVNSILLFYTVNRNKYFLSFDDGVKQTNLRKNDVLSCSIFIPKEPKEQAKIANFLSGIDDLISKQTGKIEALKHHKKALMQGLFHTVEEILK